VGLGVEGFAAVGPAHVEVVDLRREIREGLRAQEEALVNAWEPGQLERFVEGRLVVGGVFGVVAVAAFQREAAFGLAAMLSSRVDLPVPLSPTIMVIGFVNSSLNGRVNSGTLYGKSLRPRGGLKRNSFKNGDLASRGCIGIVLP
jgi:hypothetical protein